MSRDNRNTLMMFLLQALTTVSFSPFDRSDIYVGRKRANAMEQFQARDKFLWIFDLGRKWIKPATGLKRDGEGLFQNI